MVTIEVYDDGAGIPDDKKEHIFDKFYRGNTKIVDSKRSLGLLNENLSLADGSAGIKKKLIEAGALPLKGKSTLER